MKKNNYGIAASSLYAFANISGVWSDGKRSKTEITANKKDMTADITAGNTYLAFTVNIKGALLSIEE